MGKKLLRVRIGRIAGSVAGRRRRNALGERPTIHDGVTGNLRGEAMEMGCDGKGSVGKGEWWHKGVRCIYGNWVVWVKRKEKRDRS